MPAPRRAAVLGSPIEHSLSPVLHTAAYAALGLSHWTCTAIECDEAGLPALIASRGREWAGLSLTMPLKRAVLPLLDRTEPLAVEVGTVETSRSPSLTSEPNGCRSTSTPSRPAAASRSPALARLRTITTAEARPVSRRAARAAQAVAPAPRMVAPGGAATPASARAATMPGTSVL